MTTIAAGSSQSFSLAAGARLVLAGVGTAQVVPPAAVSGAQPALVTYQQSGTTVGPFEAAVTVFVRAVQATEASTFGASAVIGPQGQGIPTVIEGQTGLLLPDGAVFALSEVVTEVLANPSATTTVLSGAGLYSHYRCTTAAGNITIYDNTAASGKVLVPTTALALGSFPIFGAGNPNRLAVATGVTVVLSGAAVVYVGAGEG